MKGLEQELGNFTKKAEQMLEGFFAYAKKHKKLILTLLGIYLASKYLFGEKKDEETES